MVLGVDYMRLTEKVKEKINELDSCKAIVEYFFNSDHLEYERIFLPSIQPILRLKKYSETYKLEKPAKFEKGIPVYIIVKDFPISISISLKKEEIRRKLIENGIKSKSEKEEEKIIEGIKEKENQIQEILDELNYNLEFEEKFPTAQELDSTLNSTHTFSFFRKGVMEFKEWLVLILAVIIAILGTYLYCTLTIEPVIVETVKYINQTITNETIGMI